MTTSGSSDLSGLRLLLVEDNLVLADLLADTVRSHGGVVVGAAPDVETGVQYAREAELDGALLDINLSGELCFPIAAVLTDRRIPFLFLTGYDNSRLIPPEFRAARRLSKPTDPDGLCRAINEDFPGTAIRGGVIR